MTSVAKTRPKKARARAAKKPKSIYSLLPPDEAARHPSLQAYLTRHARFLDSVQLVEGSSRDFSKYRFFDRGQMHEGGGLLTLLERRFYPHYKTNRSRRNHRQTNIVGASSALGKTVDRQLAAWTEAPLQKPARKRNPLVEALIRHLQDAGHTPQAAQLPVVVEDSRPLMRMTQADLITRDGFGQLCLWEVKSGFPVGLFRKQGAILSPAPKGGGEPIACTKLNIWHLQLHFTRRALEAAGLEIAQANVIQVYKTRDQAAPVVKVYPQPEWVRRIKL